MYVTVWNVTVQFQWKNVTSEFYIVYNCNYLCSFHDLYHINALYSGFPFLFLNYFVFYFYKLVMNKILTPHA